MTSGEMRMHVGLYTPKETSRTYLMATQPATNDAITTRSLDY